MHLFEVQAEDREGDLKTLLVVANDAMEAYTYVAQGETVVHEVSRQSGCAVRGGRRLLGTVEEHRI